MEEKQKKAEFNPTAEQIAFAEEYTLNMGNITRACEAIGDPNRNRYYDKATGWHYQEGFEEWLSEYAKTEVLKRRGKWYLWLEAYAHKGSFQHLNLLIQIGREFVPSPLIDQSQHTHYEIKWKASEEKETVRNRIAEVQEEIKR